MKRVILIVMGSFLSFIVKGQNETTTNSFCDSILNGNIRSTFVTEVPIYPGGKKSMDQFIFENLKLPISADTIKDKIHAVLRINSKGHIENACVFKNYYNNKTNISSTPIGTEILRVIRLMPDWRSAKQNDNKISVDLVVLIDDGK